MYSTYVSPYITCMSSSAGHSYRALLLPPIVLPHSVSFIEQVGPTVRPCLSDANKGRYQGKQWPLSLGTKEPSHCTTCTLLPRSHSPYTVLHSPSYYKFLTPLAPNTPSGHENDKRGKGFRYKKQGSSHSN